MTTLKTNIFRVGRVLGLHVPIDEARLDRRYSDLQQAHPIPGARAPIFRR